MGKHIYHFILIKFVRNPVQILRNKMSTGIRRQHNKRFRCNRVRYKLFSYISVIL